MRIDPLSLAAANHAYARLPHCCSFRAWHLPWSFREEKLDRCPASRGTLFSHACAVHLLVDRVLDAPNRASLVALLRRTLATRPGYLAASPAPVLMSPITTPAYQEWNSALFAPPASQFAAASPHSAHPAPLWTRAPLRAKLLLSCGASLLRVKPRRSRSLGGHTPRLLCCSRVYTPAHPAPPARMMSTCRRLFSFLRI